jgi:hypothetical protein
MPNDIVECRALSQDALTSVMNGDSLALRVAGYYEEDLAIQLTNLLGPQGASSGSQSSIYLTEHIPFYNTVQNPEKGRLYFEYAKDWISELRFRARPFLSPMDRIRLELDEIWPAGASILRLYSRMMYFGLVRVWPESAEALPHQDVLSREVADCPFIFDQRSQLGVNVYLQTAEEGGEIEIWRKQMTSDDCIRFGIHGSYGFPRDSLGQPSCVIEPKRGDLIALNSFNVHAVRRVARGSRVTVSGFVGSWGEHRPLMLWS